MFNIKPSSRNVKVQSNVNSHKQDHLIKATVKGKSGFITRLIERKEIEMFKTMFGEDNCTFRVQQ